MLGLSPRVVQVVEAFAASMGLPARPSADGSFNFEFSRSGDLSLTGSEDGEHLLVSLARNPERRDPDLEQRVLSRAGFDPTTQSFLHSAMDSDGALFHVVEIAANDIDLPTLDAALRRLMEAHESLS